MYIVLLQSTRHVILLERVIKECNVSYRILPVPRDLSAECGMCFLVSPDDIATVKRCAESAAVQVRVVDRSDV